MAKTLPGAMKTLFCLNRWNIEPRIETWTEAENIALCTHVVYACARAIGLSEEDTLHAVKRALLKSINKHYLSDISAEIRDLIREHSEATWNAIVDEAAHATARLFRADIADHILEYMTLDGNYRVPSDRKQKIENLVTWAQYKVALSELEPSRRAFPKEFSRYEESAQRITRRMNLVEGAEEFKAALEGDGSRNYLALIRNLKHVRRWNRMNRYIESSVLAHTFLVALLALMFSFNRKDDFVDKTGVDPHYHSILLALFHDVTEIRTGDIITPVKEILNRHDPNLLPSIEERVQSEMLEQMPPSVRKEVSELKLFQELDKKQAFSVRSLVKDCDTMAALLECAFEKSVGNHNPEMEQAFNDYYTTLQNSEWDDVREFSQQVRYEMEHGMF